MTFGQLSLAIKGSQRPGVSDVGASVTRIWEVSRQSRDWHELGKYSIKFHGIGKTLIKQQIRKEEIAKFTSDKKIIFLIAPNRISNYQTKFVYF